MVSDADARAVAEFLYREARLADEGLILVELSRQAKHETHLWAGRTTHRLRRVDGALRMSHKKVVLVNAAVPLPNLAFLI
jgi:3-phenylpropionate/cinnamic acid dioxygenase small subunit